ncbi:DUF4020 domain-containing protein [Ornithinibacillus sp. L9]|uniref:DUF4020 domain-containing protein n=1 Tax=Ornithinibacillus caprae TaxID=2678566 RepID=A0A6N8FI85_9BACI|nr:SIR2 family protein [Ornithinibacillus caprae]MUK89310.1 DUF4020 domain-containing protein [Ornithinibacillus caprae]
MWITKDINLPDEIIDAQKKGELVIFAGAGVSMPPPSNLPSFEKLAIQISQGLIAYNDTIPIDTFLGKLQNRGIRVHEKAVELLISPNSKPSSYHKNLLRLFQSDQPKIVTTNFDDHFRTAAGNNQGISYYSAPALPLGRDFTGVVQLHGSVRNRPRDLVLTDSDFGKAYFTDGWATTFLRDLFANYVVLFVGFSVNDPVMKYIARGLGSNNRNRYAFTEEGNSDHWNHLQIINIEYPKNRHDLLEKSIEAWVEKSQMGAFEQRKLIKEIVEKPPAHNEVEESYILEQLKSEIGSQHYFDFANDFKWVEWMNKHKKLDSLFFNENKINPFNHNLASWLASFFQENSEGLFRLIMESGSLSDYLKRYLVREVYRKINDSSTKNIGKGIPVYLGHVNHRKKEDNLEFLLNGLKHPENKEIILILLECLTRPFTSYKKKFSIYENDEEQVEVNVDIKGDAYWLRKVWNGTILPNLDFYAIPLINIFINHLQLTTYYYKVTREGDWDPISFSRSAIEPHEQDKYPKDIDFLIDGCREILEFLIRNNSKLALGYIEQCLQSDSKILNRLSIHSYKMINEVSFKQKINWLINNDLLFKNDYKHEVFQFIKEVYPNLEPESRDALLNIISNESEKRRNEDSDLLDTETIDYEEFNLYYWLTLCDQECVLAKEHFEKARERNGHFQVRDYPDLSHWSSRIDFSTITREVTTDEILSKNPDHNEDFNWLMTYKEEDNPFDKRERFLTVITSSIEKDNIWGWSLLKNMTVSETESSDLWSAVLKGFSVVSLDDKGFQEISYAILNHCDLYNYRYYICYFFESVADKLDCNDIKFSIDIVIEIFEKILESLSSSDDSLMEEDSYTQAINHPIGRLTRFFSVFYSKMFYDGNKNDEILAAVKQKVFLRLLSENDGQSLLGKMILTNRLNIIMSIDEEWAVKELVPLFDAEIDVELAKKAWNSYVYGGKLNERSLKFLYEKLESIIPYINELNEVSKKGIFQYCASILFFSAEYNNPLLNFLKNKGNEQHFELLITQIFDTLTQLKAPAITKAWKDWLKDFLTLRLYNLPVEMGSKEMERVVELIIVLEPVIKDYIELIVNSNINVKLHSDYVFYGLSREKIGTNFPHLLLSYLKIILIDNQLYSYSEEVFEVMKQICESLDNEDENFAVVCEYLMTVNIQLAEEVINLYRDKFK